MKILMADDSAFMRKILSNILNKEGYKDLIEVPDGEQAVAKFKSEKPDLVLLDIIMEKKDGMEALKDIMKIDKKAKCIMVSAVGQEQMVKDALKAGASDFIVKPFNAEKVAESVKKVLG
jgi:two-component system chemotaxis response regulator CheY